MSTRTDVLTTQPGRARGAPGRLRLRLSVKISLFLAAILIPLAAMTWSLAVHAVRTSLSGEVTSRAAAIARGLAGAGVEALAVRDAATVQSLVDQVSSTAGVAYVLVHTAQNAPVAHTFASGVPAGLIEDHPVAGDATQQVREIRYADPASGQTRESIDVGVPIQGGRLGTVRVGMDRAAIEAAAVRAGRALLVVFGGFAVVAVLGGVIFAGRITRPVALLVAVSERVGRGDLSKLVPVTSGDEVGELAETFNQTIVRLRSQVQTEAERDEARRSREELQRNIVGFLNTVTEIARGDLTQRGQVTADVLGNVVDAINVMVAQLAHILAEVRHAAQRVAHSSSEMIAAAGPMATGAQAQTREAMSAASLVEELTRSVRRVAETAEAAAVAALKTRASAERGEDAVRQSLDGMQLIRGEVATISKRIRGLAARSAEITEIVGAIDDIASQTNLLALNASIEAAGAGEAGVRFAVVADEVRKLAERSARATKDIATVIKNVQAEIQEAIAATEQGTAQVESGHRITVQAGKSLRDIAEISQQSAELAEEISQATQRQVRGAESMAAGVHSIAGVAVQTEQGVVRSRKTVEELAVVAEELTASLARFKLSG
jgi:methyl-accepting chemotaxis protein